MTLIDILKAHISLSELTDEEFCVLMQDSLVAVDDGRREASARLQWLRLLVDEAQRRGEADAARAATIEASLNVRVRTN